MTRQAKTLIPPVKSSPIRDLAFWPEPLQRFVQARGADAVWNIGLRVLGYPPTWIDHVKEAMPVVEALNLEESCHGS